MPVGRPRQPNDPSVFASMEAAITTVTRPGITGSVWNWRYELAVVLGLPGAAVAIWVAFGGATLIALAVTGITLLTAAVLWPPARARLIAQAWCVLTPHRVRTGCIHAWVQSRHGRLPVVLWTRPTDFGERVLLWCRAGITAGDLEAARDVLAATCWARDIRVVPSVRHRHIVALDVIRRPAPRSQPDSLDPAEPAPSPQPAELRPDELLPLGSDW
jgi:hypothetical protein